MRSESCERGDPKKGSTWALIVDASSKNSDAFAVYGSAYSDTDSGGLFAVAHCIAAVMDSDPLFSSTLYHVSDVGKASTAGTVYAEAADTSYSDGNLSGATDVGGCTVSILGYPRCTDAVAGFVSTAANAVAVVGSVRFRWMSIQAPAAVSSHHSDLVLYLLVGPWEDQWWYGRFEGKKKPLPAACSDCIEIPEIPLGPSALQQGSWMTVSPRTSLPDLQISWVRLRHAQGRFVTPMASDRFLQS